MYRRRSNLPASEEFHLACVPVDVAVGPANRTVHGRLVTVHRTVFPVGRYVAARSQVRHWRANPVYKRRTNETKFTRGYGGTANPMRLCRAELPYKWSGWFPGLATLYSVLPVLLRILETDACLRTVDIIVSLSYIFNIIIRRYWA